MRSRITALWLVCGAVACDMFEGPAEETREAQEAAADGANPDQVAREAGDVHAADGVASTAAANNEGVRTTLDAQITRHEAWLTDIRREIEAGTRTENPDTKNTLDEIEHNLKEARTDLGKMVEQTGDDWTKTEAHLRGELAQVEAAIRRMDAAGKP